MKIIKDLRQFKEITKPILDIEFSDVNIISDSITGMFNSYRLDELLTYCKENPQFHIMSFLKGGQYCFVNAPVLNASFYKLGTGDQDPELMYIEPMSYERYIDSKIRKFDRDKGCA